MSDSKPATKPASKTTEDKADKKPAAKKTSEADQDIQDGVQIVEASTTSERNLIIRKTEQGALLSVRDRDTGDDVELPEDLRYLAN